MLDILNALKDAVSFYSATKTLLGGINSFQNSNFRWEFENTKADLIMKAHGHIMPVIIERLDDGINPQFQHLSIDMAPIISQERIENALYYRDTQTIQNALRAIGELIRKQEMVTWKDAESGNEHELTVFIDFLGTFARLILVMSGKVGDTNWEVNSFQRDINIRGFFKEMPERLRVQEQLRKEAKARMKTEKK